MCTINEILEFDFAPNDFIQSGEGIVPQQIRIICDSQINILNQISIRHDTIIDIPPTQGIEEIYLKFQMCKQPNGQFNEDFDRKELRLLSWALNYKSGVGNSIFENQLDLNRCLILLNSNWRTAYLSGLLNCYLLNWKTNRIESLYTLSRFILDKINTYHGTRSIYIRLRDNSDFLDYQSGDINLGSSIAQNDGEVFEAPNYLSFPSSWITYPYFFGVIDSYFENLQDDLNQKLNSIQNALEMHSSRVKGTEANKLIMSKIICCVKDQKDIQEEVKNMAFRLVGDPGIASNWAPYNGANVEQIETIQKARIILNEWVTRQFINVFFERCINDERRKYYWLRYSHRIKNFRVFGTEELKKILKTDPRIDIYVEGRFNTFSTSFNDAAAFVFDMEGYRFIEFSEQGYAFYAYCITNDDKPSFDKQYRIINEFTNSQMPYLVYRRREIITHHNKEGRLGHKDGIISWEDLFDWWINEYVQ